MDNGILSSIPLSAEVVTDGLPLIDASSDQPNETSSVSPSAETEDKEHIDESAQSKIALKYNYKEDQWSLLNPDGKKQYDRHFLLQLQTQPVSLTKPKNLPNLGIIKDKAHIQKLNEICRSIPMSSSISNYGDHLLPQYADRIGVRSRMQPPMNSNNRRVLPRRDFKNKKGFSLPQNIKLPEAETASNQYKQGRKTQLLEEVDSIGIGPDRSMQSWGRCCSGEINTSDSSDSDETTTQRRYAAFNHDQNNHEPLFIRKTSSTFKEMGNLIEASISNSDSQLNDNTTVLPDLKELRLRGDNLPKEIVEKRTKTLIDQFLHNNDIQEAIRCVTELASASTIHMFINSAINQVLERSNQARHSLGHLLCSLVKQKIITIEQYQKGLASMLKIIDEFALDIPLIWDYMGEILEPMLEGNEFPLNFLEDDLEPCIPSLTTGKLVSATLHCAAKRKDVAPVPVSPVPTLTEERSPSPTVTAPTTIIDNEILSTIPLPGDVVTDGLPLIDASPDQPSETSCVSPSAETEDKENIDETPRSKVALKYNYKEGLWSPLNPEGKKLYDPNFLLLLQSEPMSLTKPQNLPNLYDIKDKEKEKLKRSVQGILNKLTPQKFETLLSQLKNLNIDNEEKLTGVVDLIFENAVNGPHFSALYANMSKHLALLKVPTEKGESVHFRKLLLTKCQKEFEKAEADDTDKKKELEQEMYEKEKKMRNRQLGNIRFIGELFKLSMLIEPIMHECIKRLLSQGDEESLECLCELLKTIGKELDEGKNKKESMDNYFTQMQKIIDKRLTSSRVKFMLQDVINFKRNNWVPSWVANNPKTVDQIHKKAERESREQQPVLQSIPFNKRVNDDRDRRKTTVRNIVTSEEGWTSSTKSSKGSYRIVDSNKLKLTKPDEVNSIRLGPGRAMQSWGRSSSGGTKIRAGSTDPDKTTLQNRYP